MRATPIRDARGLSQAIRQRRRELGWTQDQLAARAGLVAKHVSRIETGTHEPKASTIFAVLAALGLELTLEDAHPTSGPRSPGIEHVF